MITNIDGKRYNFKIVSENPTSGNNPFYIRATHKPTRRTSCINNLNVILSELGVDSDKPEYADSMWTLPRNRAIQFVNTTKKILSDLVFTEYLEKQLDEDRTLGEW